MKRVLDITPKPRLIQSIGNNCHNIYTAGLDLIDNSIDALAEKVFVDVYTENGKVVIAIGDDGTGMDLAKLTNALCLGSDHELAEGDLGIYGLGLKTSIASIGTVATILTRAENGPVLKAVFDVPAIVKKGWKNAVTLTDEVEPETISAFETYTGVGGTGTVLIIEGSEKSGATTQIANIFKKHIGTTFHKFITSKKVAFYVNEVEVAPLDPMERHLSSTEVILDADIELNGTLAKVTLFRLDPRECAADNPSTTDDEDDASDGQGNFNFKPSPRNQGLCVYRNNRIIMEFDRRVIVPWWPKEQYGMINYIRAELTYSSDSDDYFPMNHEKTCITSDVPQSVLDKIAHAIQQKVRELYAKSRRESAAKDDTTKRVLDLISKAISQQSNLLEMVRGKKQQRERKGQKNGTVTPKNTDIKRPGPIAPTVKANSVLIGTCDWGPNGPLFDYEVEKNVFNVRFNVSHPFYVTHVSKTSKEQVTAVSSMLFALSAYLAKAQQDYPCKQTDDFVGNFMESVSRNLRILS